MFWLPFNSKKKGGFFHQEWSNDDFPESTEKTTEAKMNGRRGSCDFGAGEEIEK